MDLMKEKKFGYGCMRLPILDANDPAYTYHGYHAEEAVRK